jgi:taurine dioxygenase
LFTNKQERKDFEMANTAVAPDRQASFARKTEIYSHIGVAPLSALVGAEISNVDLSKPLSEPVFDEIERAFI